MTMLGLLNPVPSGDKKPERCGLSEDVVAAINDWWSGIDHDACQQLVTLLDQLLAEHLANLADQTEPVPERSTEEFRAACLAYIFAKVRDDALREVIYSVQDLRSPD